MQLSVLPSQALDPTPAPLSTGVRKVNAATNLTSLPPAEQVTFGALSPQKRQEMLDVPISRRQPAPDWRKVATEVGIGVGLIALGTAVKALTFFTVILPIASLYLDELGVKSIFDAWQTSRTPKLPEAKNRAEALKVLAAHDPVYPRLIEDMLRTTERLEVAKADKPHGAMAKLLTLRHDGLQEALSLIEDPKVGVSRLQPPKLVITRTELARRMKQDFPDEGLESRLFDRLHAPLNWLKDRLFQEDRATVEDVMTLTALKLNHAIEHNKDKTLYRANHVLEGEDPDWKWLFKDLR